MKKIKTSGSPIKLFSRQNLYRIIFESDTSAGKAFDVVLLIFILLSVLTVILDSVESIHRNFHGTLIILEWAFTVIFSIEYGFRVYCAQKRFHYFRSFFGVIDLLAILPNYIGIFVIGAPTLTVIRVFRLLRVFVVFKLGRYIGQANFLLNAVKRGIRKIIVFLGTVLAIVILMGTLMYLIEGPQRGFKNIPTAMYWAIVTLTTVGYGDLAPQTPLGQAIAALIMLMGYGIIAVPTGILSAEMVAESRNQNTRECPFCGESEIPKNALFCHSCGKKL